MKKRLIAACMVSCVVVSGAWGAITYVDAELDNTTVNGSTLQAEVNYSSTSYSDVTDGLWGWRTNRTDVNGDGIWVTDGGTGSIADLEDTAPLKIVITLPQAGVYDLYAILMNNNSGAGHWDIAASIGSSDPNDFIAYNKHFDEMTQAVASDFVGNVSVSGGSDMTMKVLIGQYTAQNANETVSIYINGLDAWDNQTSLEQRTRFDGVGYEKVSELLPWAVNAAPTEGDAYVLPVDTSLQWQAGDGVDVENYNVYLGTDANSVAFVADLDGSRKVDLSDLAKVAGDWQSTVTDAFGEKLDIDASGTIDMGEIALLAEDWLLCDESAFKGSFSTGTTSYDAGSLLTDTTYYWRVDEVDDETTHKGDVWEFTTFKGDGLTARIYDDAYLADLMVTRVDAQVDFDWAKEAPDDSVDPESFSIGWTGGIQVPTEGDYTFYVNSDDGARLYVNDILIIDNWTNQSVTEVSNNIYLRAGFVYPIRLEYYDNSGSASVELSWSGPDVDKEIIPTEYLCSTMPQILPKDIWVIETDPLSTAMRFLALTLEGLVAKDEAAILVEQGGLTGFIREEMEEAGTVFHDNASLWWLLKKYKDRIDGIIVCGSDLESTNAATSLCGPMNAVAVRESILDVVQERTGLPILLDMRDKDEQYVYDNYKDLFGHEIVVDTDKVDYLRDIAVARNAFIFYDVESDTRVEFVDGLTSQGLVFGWGSNAEYNWVKDVSEANAAGVPADWSKNLSTLSKIRTDIPKPPRRYPDPVQEGERIIAFSMSDGDNLQIMAGGFITADSYFGSDYRGTFPMSWEFPPTMGMMIPWGVKCYYEQATTGDNLDCFIAGPSGAGYAFHHFMPGTHTFAKNTGQIMQKCGLTVTTLINENDADLSEVDQFLERPEIMGIAYKDWAPYNNRDGEIYWHNGKPCVGYKYLLWNELGDPNSVSEGIAAMPSSPATDEGSYAMINANAWAFSDDGGPMQAIVDTIELLPENTRLVTVEELIILLRNNFGDPVTEEEYYDM